jgi:hypothetical protein
LSERLSEIAAREARGIGAPRREGVPRTAGPRPERPTGQRAREYAQQPTERRTAPPGPTPAGARRPERTSQARRPAAAQDRAGHPERQTHPSGRTPVRTPTGRRPAGPSNRLMRQRLFVFVIVTLLAAVCIAALQGCHRFTSGLPAPAPVPVTAPHTTPPPAA